MEFITLSNSSLTVSRICMGCCPMGRYGWGKVEEKELIEAVHKALDLGINFFDTADTYGLGESERILGKALRQNRQNAIIASKFGVRVENGRTFYDNSPNYIRQALSDSLKRLGTDYIDLYQIHYRDGVTPIQEVINTLEELKNQGYIRYYGISNIYKKDIDELMPYKNRFSSFQDEYSLACRKNEEDILKLSDILNINPMTWGSLGQGVLSGKYSEKNMHFEKGDRRLRDIYVNFHGEKFEKNMQIVTVLKEIAEKYDKPLSAVALRFILDFLPNSIALCGAKRPAQIVDNSLGANWHLEGYDLHRLEQVSRD